MAAPNNATHMLLTLNGSYRSGPAAGAEIWQIGVRLYVGPSLTAPDSLGTLPSIPIVEHLVSRTETDWDINGIWRTETGISDFDPSDYLNDNAGPAAHDLITDSHFASDVQIDTVKIYPVSTPDAKIAAPPGYGQGAPVILDFTGTKPSGGGSQGLPPQDTVVASLRTPQTGRTGRGRMYLPAMDRAIMSNLVVSSTACDDIADLMHVFLESLRLSGSSSGVWCTPIVTGHPYTKYAVVNNVIVDNVVDTQQRRRRSIPATQHNHTVTPWS
jgi:hypothetical protein